MQQQDRMEISPNQDHDDERVNNTMGMELDTRIDGEVKRQRESKRKFLKQKRSNLAEVNKEMVVMVETKNEKETSIAERTGKRKREKKQKLRKGMAIKKSRHIPITEPIEVTQNDEENRNQQIENKKEGEDFTVFELMGIPLEVVVKIWLGELDPEEMQHGGFAIILVSRRVCHKWRVGLSGIWEDILAKYKISVTRRLIPSKSFPGRVAFLGWQGLLDWAIEQGFDPSSSKEKAKSIFWNAAGGGQMEVMEKYGTHITTQAVANAMKHGKIEAVVWCIDHSSSVSMPMVATRCAFRCGQLAMLQFLLQRYPFNAKERQRMMYFAAHYGQVDMAEWMHSTYHMDLDDLIALDACKTGQLPFIKWLHAKGVVLPSDLIVVALKNHRTATAAFMVNELRIACPPHLRSEIKKAMED